MFTAPTADSSTRGLTNPDTQAVPPPGVGPPTSTDLRDGLLATTQRRLMRASHPTFAPRQMGGLGAAAGYLFGTLTNNPGPMGTVDLCRRSGLGEAAVWRLGGLLTDHDLVRHTMNGWMVSEDNATAGHLDRMADRLGVAHLPVLRRQQHVDEQLLWRWWCDELAWMRLPRADKRQNKIRDHDGQLALIGGAASGGLTVRGRLGPMPRTDAGRINWAAARASVAARRTITPAQAAA